jgi:transmembrane sensor
MQPIKSLLQRFLSNEATPEEIAEILAWLRTNEHNEALLQEVWEEQRLATPPADWQDIWMQVDAATRPLAEPVRRTYPIRRLWPAVAAALILLVAGLFLVIRRQGATGSGDMPITAGVADAAPGRDGAILTLTDGSRISLDSAGKGVPATQGGAKISLQGNRLAYTPTADVTNGNGEQATSPLDLTYNMVTTPRGRQFSLLLPDGSRVWLNAASSLRFPTAFAGKERRVELTGEAYFEIAKDKSRPFIVQTDNTETEVLGTSFNISAYRDEDAVDATLIEGRIRTGSQAEQVTLIPGEQAKMGAKVAVNHQANVEQAIAWKNGAFNFESMGLKEVMRQLARWYDLDVVYEPGVKDFKFGGEMSRNVPLSSLLKGLQDMEVHFRIENDHKLVVMP